MSLSKLQAIFPCFTCTSHDDAPYPDEKASLLAANKADHQPRTAALVADDVINVLLTTDLRGPALQMRLDSIVGTYGWRENVAKWMLEKLSRMIEWGHDDFGPAMRDAYEKSLEAARATEGFVKEHPVFFTVVALGVLAVLMPAVLGLLGFAELGIEEGM